MNRSKEFTQRYYDWIVKCLREDNILDVLAFFVLGCELGIRQKELASITWNQVQNNYISGVECSVQRNKEQKLYYPIFIISDETLKIINEGCRDDTKLFPKDIMWYVNQIREFCGDSRFSGHDIRRIAMILKYNKVD